MTIKVRGYGYHDAQVKLDMIEEGILNGEVVMGMNGATIVDTGAYTGRSPNDKFLPNTWIDLKLI